MTTTPIENRPPFPTDQSTVPIRYSKEDLLKIRQLWAKTQHLALPPLVSKPLPDSLFIRPSTATLEGFLHKL